MGLLADGSRTINGNPIIAELVNTDAFNEVVRIPSEKTFDILDDKNLTFS